jgi:hypothetical protein
MTAWPLVYIAGPYSQPDPVLNTRAAIDWAEQVAKLAAVPVVPHLSHLWHLISPHDYEWWLAYDLAILARCDALLRIPGNSPGADREVEWAGEHGIPVARSLSWLHRVLANREQP